MNEELNFNKNLNRNEILPHVDGDKESKNEIEKLREENEKLKNTLEKINNISSLIFHDIRNSLNGVIAFNDLSSKEVEELMKKGGDISVSELETVKNYIKIVSESGDNSLELTNDMLIFNKSAMGKLEKTDMILVEQLYNVLGSLSNDLNNKNIKLDNKVPNNIDVNFNKDVLKIVFRNLVTNAIKFTPEGGLISVSANENEKEVKIYVKDNGIGLSKEKINNLFKDIVVSGIGTNNELGTGMGLYLCHDILKNVSGNLEVESEGEGKGSTFIITIPKEVKSE